MARVENAQCGGHHLTVATGVHHGILIRLTVVRDHMTVFALLGLTRHDTIQVMVQRHGMHLRVVLTRRRRRLAIWIAVGHGQRLFAHHVGVTQLKLVAHAQIGRTIGGGHGGQVGPTVVARLLVA